MSSRGAYWTRPTVVTPGAGFGERGRALPGRHNGGRAAAKGGGRTHRAGLVVNAGRR